MIKDMLYNWGGINQKLFLAVNSIFGHKYLDNVIILFDDAAGHHNFRYHFTLLILLAAFFIYKKRHHPIKLRNETIRWVELTLTILISLFFTCTLIFELKNLFEVARPYCTPGLGDIHVIPYVVDPVPCNHSFPSGHMSFITVMVASLWPFANRPCKYLLVATLCMVAISRMASSAHYPADLFWAFIICLPITIFTRKIVKHVLNRYYNYYKKLFIWLN
jgi:hypothetical protein